MPEIDGSINTNTWSWDDPPVGVGLPTLTGASGWKGVPFTGAPPYQAPLGVGGAAAYDPSRDMPINRAGQWLGGAFNNLVGAIFPQGQAGQGNPNFWNTQANGYEGGKYTQAWTDYYATHPNGAEVTYPNRAPMPFTSAGSQQRMDELPPNLNGTNRYAGMPNPRGEGNIPFTNSGAPTDFAAGLTGTIGALNNWQKNFAQYSAMRPQGAGGGNGGGGASGYGAGGSGASSWKNGMTPDEMKYANKAEYWSKLLGQDPAQFWGTTKSVYMNRERNGNTDPDAAMGRQVDDILWGNAARAAGILTGNAAADAIVWRDHYTAGGTFLPNGSINPSDPMAGHNYAADNLKAAQDALKQAANPDTYPAWLTP